MKKGTIMNLRAVRILTVALFIIIAGNQLALGMTVDVFIEIYNENADELLMGHEAQIDMGKDGSRFSFLNDDASLYFEITEQEDKLTAVAVALRDVPSPDIEEYLSTIDIVAETILSNKTRYERSNIIWETLAQSGQLLLMDIMGGVSETQGDVRTVYAVTDEGVRIFIFYLKDS
ncbi:MAG: hypothetical protein ACOYI5_04800 [Christensenellales bacterium]|jgi:hypothetical protein